MGCPRLSGTRLWGDESRGIVDPECERPIEEVAGE